MNQICICLDQAYGLLTLDNNRHECFPYIQSFNKQQISVLYTMHHTFSLLSQEIQTSNHCILFSQISIFGILNRIPMLAYYSSKKITRSNTKFACYPGQWLLRNISKIHKERASLFPTILIFQNQYEFIHIKYNQQQKNPCLSKHLTISMLSILSKSKTELLVNQV